ncbi:hypothetical protein Bca101_071626 [Brassica carinata]
MSLMERATVMRWECMILILRTVWGRPCSPHSERAGHIALAYGEGDGMDRAHHMTNGPGRTALGIWRAGWKNRTRPMASGPERTAFTIWRAGQDEPRSPYGERAGMNRVCHMRDGTDRARRAVLTVTPIEMKQGTVRSWFDGESYGDEMRVQDRSQRQREFEIELLRKDALYYPIFGERKNLSHSIQILTSEPFILNPDLSSLSGNKLNESDTEEENDELNQIDTQGAEGVAVSPGWLGCGVSYASSWSSVSFLLSRSVPFSGARRSCHRFQAMLVCYGFSPAGARARRSVAGVVNHRCYFWWRRVRVCKFQGVDCGPPLDRFDLRRGLLALSFGVGSVVCGGFGGSFSK